MMKIQYTKTKFKKKSSVWGLEKWIIGQEHQLYKHEDLYLNLNKQVKNLDTAGHAYNLRNVVGGGGLVGMLVLS